MSKGMEQVDRRSIRWRWGLLAALAMMLLSFYPQLHFWVVRGSNWNGSYAVIEGVGDEVAYSAYVNALIDGRPRRNDPYTGRDYNEDKHQSDSLFSIQFVPAYLIAIPARLLGLSAATAFILLSPLAAGATALALFWLLVLGSGHERLAAAGVVVVLCFGTVVAGHGHITSFFGQQPLYNYLMFLRRYQPAATFPLFFLFCGTVWLAITTRRKMALGAAAIAGMLFTLLVFSYVYLWTAAAAWTVCLAVIWEVARPGNWRAARRSFAVVGAGMLVALTCFTVLFSNRAETLDSIQALELSRAPDLFRVPELIGLGILGFLGYGCWRKSIHWRDKKVLLALTFALLPLIVFNQQVITGRSLQPLHYEMFVANYSVLIAAVLSTALIFKTPNGNSIRMPPKAVLWIALAAFEWGAYETLVAARGSVPFGQEVDDARLVALRLREFANDHDGSRHPTLLSSDLLVADSLPTTAPHSVLWAPHMLVFSGVSEAESKERFYQYLYYTNISSERLRTILRTEGRYGFAVGLFGFERTIRGLSRNPNPVTAAELDAEIRKYEQYCAGFGESQAARPRISYVVVRADENLNLANLDNWYERDAGERIGKFLLYRTRLRDQKQLSARN